MSFFNRFNKGAVYRIIGWYAVFCFIVLQILDALDKFLFNLFGEVTAILITNVIVLTMSAGFFVTIIFALVKSGSGENESDSISKRKISICAFLAMLGSFGLAVIVAKSTSTLDRSSAEHGNESAEGGDKGKGEKDAFFEDKDFVSYDNLRWDASWDNDSKDELWISNRNWSRDRVPVAGDKVLISGSYQVNLKETDKSLPRGLSLTIDNGASLLFPSGSVVLFEPKLTIGSRGSLKGTDLNFSYGKFNFQDGASVTCEQLELSGINLLNFELSVTGFTKLSFGKLTLGTHNGKQTAFEDIQVVVDMAKYKGVDRKITLLELNQSSVKEDDIDNLGFVKIINAEKYPESFLKWNSLNSSLELIIPHGSGDIALISKITTSSEFNDDYVGDFVLVSDKDWASAEQNPWIQLNWEEDHIINALSVSDRLVKNCDANKLKLIFSDGSTLDVSGIPNDGTPKVVSFSPKIVDWVRFEITGGNLASAIGLSEVKVFAAIDVAPESVVSASSEYDHSNRAELVLSPSGEWASKGESKPWIQLDWDHEQTVDTVIIKDRLILNNCATNIMLSFSDGTQLNVVGIPDDGKAKDVRFPSKTVKWIRLQVLKGDGTDIGLSEIKVLKVPKAVKQVAINIAGESKITCSSTFSDVYHEKFVLTRAGEWASNEKKPWIQLNWDADKTIDMIVLRDRIHTGYNVNKIKLSFSDGSTLDVPDIPTNGLAKVVEFPRKTIKWVRFDAVGGNSTAIGLTEIQVYTVGE